MHVFRMAFPWNNRGIPKIGYMLTCLGLSSQGYTALRLWAHTQGDERPTRHADQRERCTHTCSQMAQSWAEPHPPQPQPHTKCSLQRGCRQWGRGPREGLNDNGVKHLSASDRALDRLSLIPLPLQNYPNRRRTAAEHRHCAQSPSTILLIFTPRDGVLPKGSKL